MPRSQIEEDADVYGGKISTYGLSKNERLLARSMTNLQLKEDIFGYRGYSCRREKPMAILREMD